MLRLGEDIVEGLELEDGTREHLTLADIGLCIAAKEQLFKESMKVAFRVFRPIVSERCTCKIFCEDSFRRLSSKLEEHVEDIANPDPTGVFHTKFKEGELCVHCQTMVEERDTSERRAVWDKLPRMFGVASLARDRQASTQTLPCSDDGGKQMNHLRASDAPHAHISHRDMAQIPRGLLRTSPSFDITTSLIAAVTL